MATNSPYSEVTANHLQAIASCGRDLFMAGNLDGAGVIFRGLLALNPNDPEIHTALGSILHDQGHLVEAEASYDAAIQIDDQMPLARTKRGEIRCKRGDLGGLDDLRIAAPHSAEAQALLRLFAQ